jgi:uncharacterized membrane-anchored protein YjiN (DUF445 family)
MPDPSMQDIVTDVEKELLQAIIKNLKANLMTEDQARELAREFLALLPMQDKKDLLTKLYSFSQKHVEAKSVYLKYAKPFEEEERVKKLELMSQHIQNGQIEHAITVAKGGTPN